MLPCDKLLQTLISYLFDCSGWRMGVCRVLSVYGKESDGTGGCSSGRGKYVTCG